MGCLCLIPSNKCSKQQKTIRIMDNTGRLSPKIITVNSSSRMNTINNLPINRMTPGLWLIVFQFLSIDDLVWVSQCNKELKEIARQNIQYYKDYNANSLININQAQNNNSKDNHNDNYNKTKNSHPTLFNSNLLPLTSKIHITQSIRKKISSCSNNQYLIENEYLKGSNDNKIIKKYIPVNTFSSEPLKVYTIQLKSNKNKSTHGIVRNSYIDTFTQQQINFSNNSISMSKKKSLSNISLNLENKTPSFSEDNSSNNQIVNITNINTINIAPIIINTNNNNKANLHAYVNHISVLKRKDNG